MNQTLPYDWKMELHEDAERLSAEHKRLSINLADDAWDARQDGNVFAGDLLADQSILHSKTANILDALLDEYVGANT